MLVIGENFLTMCSSRSPVKVIVVEVVYIFRHFNQYMFTEFYKNKKKKEIAEPQNQALAKMTFSFISTNFLAFFFSSVFYLSAGPCG